jgi:hypothetical protein
MQALVLCCRQPYISGLRQQRQQQQQQQQQQQGRHEVDAGGRAVLQAAVQQRPAGNKKFRSRSTRSRTAVP